MAQGETEVKTHWFEIAVLTFFVADLVTNVLVLFKH